jgi:hypothetical protein
MNALRQSMRRSLRTLLGTASACTVLAWLGPVVLDNQPLNWAQDDHHHEWLLTQELSDAQRQARADYQRELRDAARCRQLHGEAALVWTADDMPVCVPRRAIRLPEGTRLATGENQP